MEEQQAQQQSAAAANAPADTTETKKQGTSLIRGLLIGAVAAIIFALLATFAVFMFGIYRLGWYNNAAYQFSRVVPLSAAKVDDKRVSLKEYLKILSGIHRLYEAETQGQPSEDVRSFDEIREQIYLDLIDRRLSEKLAEKYGIVITDEEVNAEFEKSKEQLATIAAVGWSDQEIKDILLKPSLLQQKIAAAVAEDAALKEEAKKKIEDIKTQLEGGANFEELAKEFSQDPGSAANGGDLQYFERGVMTQSFEDAAFSLQPGELSGIVETEYGYHIIKTEEVEKKNGKVEKVHARHILILYPDFESELQKIRDLAKIQKYIKFSAE